MKHDQLAGGIYRASSWVSHHLGIRNPEALRGLLPSVLTFMVLTLVALIVTPPRMTPNGKIDRKVSVRSRNIRRHEFNRPVSQENVQDAVTPDMSGGTWRLAAAKLEILPHFLVKFLQRNHVSENADFSAARYTSLGMRLIAEINKLLDRQLGLNDSISGAPLPQR